MNYKNAVKARRKQQGAVNSRVREALAGMTPRTAQMMSYTRMTEGIQIDRNAHAKAISLVSELLGGFGLPSKPALKYQGMIKNATAKDGTVTDGVVKIGATIVTLMGHKADIDIPVIIKDKSLIEPAVFFYNGAPYILSKAALDDIVRQGSLQRGMLQRHMYSPSLPDGMMSEEVTREDIINREHMFSSTPRNRFTMRRQYNKTAGGFLTAMKALVSEFSKLSAVTPLEVTNRSVSVILEPVEAAAEFHMEANYLAEQFGRTVSLNTTPHGIIAQYANSQHISFTSTIETPELGEINVEVKALYSPKVKEKVYVEPDESYPSEAASVEVYEITTSDGTKIDPESLDSSTQAYLHDLALEAGAENEGGKYAQAEESVDELEPTEYERCPKCGAMSNKLHDVCLSCLQMKNKKAQKNKPLQSKSYVSYYDSFDRNLPIDDINWQKTDGKAHGEDGVTLLITKNDAMYNTFFHGRVEDPYQFASKKQDETGEYTERMISQISGNPTIVSMQQMQDLLNKAGFSVNIYNELMYREDGEDEDGVEASKKAQKERMPRERTNIDTPTEFPELWEHAPDAMLDPAERCHEDMIPVGSEVTLHEDAEVRDRGGIPLVIPSGEKGTVLRDMKGDGLCLMVEFADMCVTTVLPAKCFKAKKKAQAELQITDLHLDDTTKVFTFNDGAKVYLDNTGNLITQFSDGTKEHNFAHNEYTKLIPEKFYNASKKAQQLPTYGKRIYTKPEQDKLTQAVGAQFDAEGKCTNMREDRLDQEMMKLAQKDTEPGVYKLKHPKTDVMWTLYVEPKEHLAVLEGPFSGDICPLDATCVDDEVDGVIKAATKTGKETQVETLDEFESYLMGAGITLDISPEYNDTIDKDAQTHVVTMEEQLSEDQQNEKGQFDEFKEVTDIVPPGTSSPTASIDQVKNEVRAMLREGYQKIDIMSTISEKYPEHAEEALSGLD